MFGNKVILGTKKEWEGCKGEEGVWADRGVPMLGLLAPVRTI